MLRNPGAGRAAPASALIDTDRLLTAYHDDRPDPTVAAQRVVFGTSGHRGSSLSRSFNAEHVLAITQALCDHRRLLGITGPLFLGIDTHALSAPAAVTATEVLAANGVELMRAGAGVYTPTPAISHAILAHNARMARGGGGSGVADGIVMTPSHNPPGDGGYKYNPPNGGPAGQDVTDWIEAAANRYLVAGLTGVRRMPWAAALRAPTTHPHDCQPAYVAELGQVINMPAIRRAGLRLLVDPMGGAGVHYWAAIAEQHQLDLTVLSDAVDPRFAFMPLDWDGQIRMDPSSPDAMQRLIARAAASPHCDIAFACDTDHDRHGIVTPSGGLLPPNHYLCVAIDHLCRHRALWPAHAAIGKSMVSTQLIDRVAAARGRRLFEVPVGFKWFAAGLLDGRLGFAGEESAGAAFLRRDGRVWTTDKDGITAALLSAEITAVAGRDPGALYAELAAELGQPATRLVEAAATPAQRRRLGAVTAQQMSARELAGEPVTAVLTHAPGNGAPLGGIKVCTRTGWFAARPSGTEALYKVYAESFAGPASLQCIVDEAQALVDGLMAAAGPA
jgi:phosphoglucomutase